MKSQDRIIFYDAVTSATLGTADSSFVLPRDAFITIKAQGWRVSSVTYALEGSSVEAAVYLVKI